jgi:hypothetical protein
MRREQGCEHSSFDRIDGKAYHAVVIPRCARCLSPKF